MLKALCVFIYEVHYNIVRNFKKKVEIGIIKDDLYICKFCNLSAIM